MIVVLEGMAGTGKTTVAKVFEDHGFTYFKDSYPAYTGQDRLALCYEYLNAFKNVNKDIDVVIDRCIISAYMYEKYYRNRIFSIGENKEYFYLDRMLEEMKVKYIYLHRDENYEDHTFDAFDIDVKEMESEYRYRFNKSVVKNKFIFDISEVSPEDIFDKVVSNEHSEIEEDKMFDFYLASPFFNEEQCEREEFVKNSLRERGYSVYAPREHGIVAKNESNSVIKEVFDSNVESIKSSKRVIAITDGKDMGTIWEVGYAYGIGKEVVYFAETLGNNPFNLMLSESGVGIYTSRASLVKAILDNDWYHKSEVVHE